MILLSSDITTCMLGHLILFFIVSLPGHNSGFTRLNESKWRITLNYTLQNNNKNAQRRPNAAGNVCHCQCQFLPHSRTDFPMSIHTHRSIIADDIFKNRVCMLTVDHPVKPLNQVLIFLTLFKLRIFVWMRGSSTIILFNHFIVLM